MLLRATAFAVSIIPAVAVAGEFFTLKGHGGPVKEIDVSEDGQSILTASFDYSAGLWRNGDVHWLEGHEAAVNTVQFLGDARAVTGGDDFAVYLWDLAENEGIRLGEHTGKVIALDAAPDHSLIASASWDGRIGLWPVNGGPARFIEGHRGPVADVRFTGDGTGLYSAGTDGTVRLWDVASGDQKALIVKHGWGVNKLILNETDGWLAYGGLDGGTRVVDLQTGAQLADLTLDRRPILAMAASPDFSQLAVGDGDGFIMVVDCATWSITRDFRATLRGPVWALHFSADGANLHAGGLDDAMYSWPVESLDKHEQMTKEERTFLIKPEEMGNGERQFQRKCSICHALGPDGLRRAGPTLYGIFGRDAGSLEGYSYSQTLQTADLVWTDETIDRMFDIGPDHYVPGSKMPMQRIVKPEDRADLIAFLKTATKVEGD